MKSIIQIIPQAFGYYKIKISLSFLMLKAYTKLYKRLSFMIRSIKKSLNLKLDYNQMN